MFNFFLKSPFIQKLWEKPNTDLRSEEKGIPWCLGCGCRMWLNLSSFIHPSAIWIPNRTALVAVRADGSYFCRFSVRCRFDMRVWLWDLKCGDIIIFFDVLFPLGEFKFTSVYSSFCLFLLLCMLMCVSC